MNSLLKEKSNKNKSDIYDIEYKIDLCKNKIDLNKKHINALKQNNEELIKQKKKKIEDSCMFIEEINSKIEEELDRKTSYLKELNKSKKQKKKYIEVEKIIKQLEKKKLKIVSDVDFYKKGGTCPTCKQYIADDFSGSIVHEKKHQLEKIQDALKELGKEYNSFHDINLKIDELSKNLYNSEAVLNEYYSNGATHEHFINAFNEEITQLKEKIIEIKQDDDIQQLQQELIGLETSKEHLVNDREIYAVASVLLKDGGIKTKIVKQYIPVMNKLINNYLAMMDFFVNFELDENFTEKIRSRYRDEFSYENFSEGEKIRINLAILFAWMAIAKLRNSSSCSLLIMDEILDGSLDVEGTETFMKILRPITTDRNVFVISHKWNFQDKFDKVLEFKKTKNFSRLVA
jgi:DNA repair exonuclease SbcCD ATPase subunit